MPKQGLEAILKIGTPKLRFLRYINVTCRVVITLCLDHNCAYVREQRIRLVKHQISTDGIFCLGMIVWSRDGARAVIDLRDDPDYVTIEKPFYS